MTTRREFLGAVANAGLAIAGTTLGGCSNRPSAQAAPFPPPDPAAGPGSLKVHAAVRDVLYGCTVDSNLLAADESYAALVRQQASIIAGESAMQWAQLRPASDAFNFDQADALVAFAEKDRMKIRGSALCAHRELPAWFGREATLANARRLLTAHIEQVAGRYAGRMHSWDAVSEAVLPSDGRADGLRDSPWLRLVGTDYIEQAFQSARAADPQALLTYTDFGIEGEDAASESKRAAVLVLLRRLKARQVPVDAVGIAAHITAGHTYGPGLARFIAAARGLGLQVFLTAMDVSDREWPADEGIRDAAVAECYGSFLDLALADPAVRVVMTRGITDRSALLSAEDPRKDGLPQRCLPFDRNDAPAKAFFAMRDAFDRRRVM